MIGNNIYVKKYTVSCKLIGVFLISTVLTVDDYKLKVYLKGTTGPTGKDGRYS